MEAEVYPQVLRVDLKSPSGNYYTSTERFASSEEYVKYVDWQMMSGYKVIGTRPYELKPKEDV
jgi:hypothetical protein